MKCCKHKLGKFWQCQKQKYFYSFRHERKNRDIHPANSLVYVRCKTRLVQINKIKKLVDTFNEKFAKKCAKKVLIFKILANLRSTLGFHSGSSI